ncbi:MAG TPA: formate dehydrogenase [Alphaproteobacteria bacterium]
MKNRLNAEIGRRDLLRVLAVGAAAATTTAACDSAHAGDFPDKRKARYRANSANVQAFYRVNRYPAK